MIRRYPLALLGLAFGPVVWIASSAYDHYVLGLGTFLECLVNGHETTIAARMTAVVTGVLVGCAAQVFADRIASGQRMAALFEHSNDGQILLDPDTGRILEANARVSDFLGYSREEILSMSLANLHPHDFGEAEAFMELVLCNGRGTNDQVSCRRKDGTLMPAEVSARVFQDAGRRYVVVSMRDISKRAKAQAEREAALAEAQIASRAKSDFLAVMSHELRTPLNAIIGFAEMIAHQQLGSIRPAAYRDYAHHIAQSGHYLLTVIDDILSLTRIEQGKDPLRPSWTDLDAVTRGMTQIYGPLAKEAGLSLQVELASDASPACVDEPKVKQILTNLLSNAVKYTPAGGHIIVRHKTTPAFDHVLEVEDSGIGMTQDQIARTAEPFLARQAGGPHHSGTRIGGLGLGLPLARRLAEVHGGRLDIASSPGMGTRIAVTFPPDPMNMPRMTACGGR